MSEQGNAVEALGPVVADYYMVHVKSLVGTKLGPFYAGGPSQAIDLANKFLEENYPLFGTMLSRKGGLPLDHGTNEYEESVGYIVDVVDVKGDYVGDAGSFTTETLASGQYVKDREQKALTLGTPWQVSDVLSYLRECKGKEATSGTAAKIALAIKRQFDDRLSELGNDLMGRLLDELSDANDLPDARPLNEYAEGDSMALGGEGGPCPHLPEGMYLIVRTPEPKADGSVDDGAEYVLQLGEAPEVTVKAKDLYYD